MENKKMKLLGIILFVVGALINIIPELFSSIASVILMLVGLFLQFKNGVSKNANIVGIIFNVISILICTYFLIAEMQHKGGNFKLGSLPMTLTAVISIILSIGVIVITIILNKKKAVK